MIIRLLRMTFKLGFHQLMRAWRAGGDKRCDAGRGEEKEGGSNYLNFNFSTFYSD